MWQVIMSKGQLKGTLFCICVFIIVLVSVFSFVELSSNIDQSQEGILIDLENDTEKKVSIIINGVYQYRIFPWIYKDQFHGNISIVTENQKNVYSLNYYDNYGVVEDRLETPWRTIADYYSIKDIKSGVISIHGENKFIVFPASTREEAIALARQSNLFQAICSIIINMKNKKRLLA